MTTRNCEVKLRLTPEEREKLQKKADKLGLKISQLIRMISINAGIDIE